jgi:hypothetical protein
LLGAGQVILGRLGPSPRHEIDEHARDADARIGRGGVLFERLLKGAQRVLSFFLGKGPVVPGPAKQGEIGCRKITRVFAFDLAGGSLDQLQLNLPREPANDLVLRLREIAAIYVEPVGPKMCARIGIDQLRVGLKRFARAADAPLDDIANAELAAELFHVSGFALVPKRGVARDDEAVRDAGEIGRQIVGHGIGESVLSGIARQIVERQDNQRQALCWLLPNRNGLRARVRSHGCRRSDHILPHPPDTGRKSGDQNNACRDNGGLRRSAASPSGLRLDLTERRRGDRRGAHRISSHRPRDVFDALITKVPERERKPVADMVAYRARDADTARFGQPFEPCRDIHAVAENVNALDNNVAEIDPDAEADPLVFGNVALAIEHAALHLGGAAHRIHYARELSEQPVASRLHNAAAMLADFWIDQLAPMRLEALKGALLVRAHQTRIARHVGGENSGKAPGGGHI